METVVLTDRITRNFSDEEFLQFCADNRDLRIERTNTLQVIIMSPVTSKSGFYSGAVFAQLFNWSVSDKRGIAFDSSAGFTLPDRSVLSPDASWISRSRWDKLSEDDQNRFAPICPEFIIEVRSKSDGLPELQKKTTAWIHHGAALAWLIDPIDQVVYIYGQSGRQEIVKDFDRKITGESPVEGFILDLSLLKI